MRTTFRVAMVLGLMTMSVTAVQAEELERPTDEITTQILVMNNYLSDVRIYIEDADGTLHSMGRLPRGRLADFTVPEELTDRPFRVKIYPAPRPGSRIAAEAGVKTNPLHAPRDQQVRVWLEPDLTDSIVEVARD